MNSDNKDLALFTDVSVSPGLKLGVGAYVVVPASFLETFSGAIRKPEIAGQIKTRRFEDTSSTKLELHALLWAIEEIRQVLHGVLTIYTDSQCIFGLLKRKVRLTSEGFLSKKTGKELGNAPLYRTFYHLHDTLNFQVVKVKGHSSSGTGEAALQIFSCVDKAARKALRIWLKELAKEQTQTNSPWCVYVLKCSNDSLYIGMTNDLGKRIKKHERGTGSKYVRSWRPFELAKTIQCNNEEEARRLEYALKKLTRKKKFEYLDLERENRGY